MTDYDDYLAEAEADRAEARARLAAGVTLADSVVELRRRASTIPMNERAFRHRAVMTAAREVADLGDRVKQLVEPFASLSVRDADTSHELERLGATVSASLPLLAELSKSLRPRGEECLRLLSDLAAERGEEERLAAEAKAAAERQARIDAEIARRVQNAEAERLAAVEAGIRSDLMASA